MIKTIVFTLLSIGLISIQVSAQTLGGCARNKEGGYVTVIKRVTLVYWAGGDSATRVIPGDELRFCRYEGNYAVVTIWARGVGYLISRSAIDSVRSRPTLREVTDTDIACIGREIETIQQKYTGDQQDWKLLELARRRKISLSMLAEIRMAYGVRTDTIGHEIPPCNETNKIAP